MYLTNIARIAHEINRAICIGNGDHSQLPWDEAPEWQRASYIAGVEYKLNNIDATPEDLHEAWSKTRRADGWTFGPHKDEINKYHPCLIPYDQLPKAQQVKDYVFGELVRQLKDI